MKKNVLVIAIAALVSTSAMAVNLSSSVTHGTTQSVTTVNKHVDINGQSHALKYTQGRHSYEAPVVDINDGSNTGGVPVVDHHQVTVTLDVSRTLSDLTQDITGTVTNNVFTDSTSLSAGNLTVTEGNRISDVTQRVYSQMGGMQKTWSGNVEVVTTSTEDYTGQLPGGGNSKLGNDVMVHVGDYSFSTEGDAIDTSAAFDNMLTGLTTDTVTITGQDLGADPQASFSLDFGNQREVLTDNSLTETTGTTRTTTLFTEIK